MFSKIWKDPVWSKVIASIIIGTSLLGYAAIEEKTKGISFKGTFNSLLNTNVKLSYVFIVLFICYIIKWTASTLFKKDNLDNDSLYNSKRNELKKFDRMQEDNEQILFRWDVYFDTSQKPFIAHLEAYCLRHGEHPIRFMHRKCPVTNCENHNRYFNENEAKNYIESVLTSKWNKLSRL